jgi:hypothetical protein
VPLCAGSDSSPAIRVRPCLDDRLGPRLDERIGKKNMLDLAVAINPSTSGGIEGCFHRSSGGCNWKCS